MPLNNLLPSYITPVRPKRDIALRIYCLRGVGGMVDGKSSNKQVVRPAILVPAAMVVAPSIRGLIRAMPISQVVRRERLPLVWLATVHSIRNMASGGER
jgi:hypothetical protein